MSDPDLDRMKELARSASPKWESEEHDPTEIRIRVSGGNVHGYTCFVSMRWCHPSQNAEQRANAAYLIAAQPRAILSLIERMEKAEAENATLRADLAEAVEALDPFAEENTGRIVSVGELRRASRIVAKHKEPTHG